MMRIFPYSFFNIEIQKDGFDNPNRLFKSIESIFRNISEQEGNVKELIPEFYYLPEMLININRLNFGKGINEKFIDNVGIPEDYQGEEKKENIDIMNILIILEKREAN